MGFFGFNFVEEGKLDIKLRTSIIGTHSIRDLPTLGNSTVAAIGVSGVTSVKQGQPILNLMGIGDLIQKIIFNQRCKFKKHKEVESLDMFQAYRKRKRFIFGFAFSVKEGDYIQKALFAVAASKITQYDTNSRHISGVSNFYGFESIEFEFEPESASVNYTKNLDEMFTYRVKEQQRKILDAALRQK